MSLEKQKKQYKTSRHNFSRTLKKIEDRFGPPDSQQKPMNACDFYTSDSEKEMTSSRIFSMDRCHYQRSGLQKSYRPIYEDCRFLSSSSKDVHYADEYIDDEVFKTLSLSDSMDTAEVHVTVKDGMVTLQGLVANIHMKRAIEEQVARCPGVREIRNYLTLRGQAVETKPDIFSSGSRSAHP